MNEEIWTGTRDVANCALNRDEVDGEILSSRKWIGRKPALIPARRSKDAEMCLSRGIIKRVAPTFVTPSDRNEVGNNVSDTRLVCGFALASIAQPSTLHSPFRPPPTYPYTRVRRRFRLLIKTRVREGFQGFCWVLPRGGGGVGSGCMDGRRVFPR